MLRATLVAVGIALAAASCSQISAQITAFEQRAAPVIARACDTFRQAETNPWVQIALAGGATAATLTTGIPVGTIVAEIRAYGDAFCAKGPPVGDTTTEQQQAAWLVDVTQKMLGVAATAK